MSDQPKNYHFKSIRHLADRLRDDFKSGGQDFVLLYAYNCTGKTRLSMEFKNTGKRKNGGNPDTLYFNAYTQDLFNWDNDLQDDSRRMLRLNSASRYLSGLNELALEENIQSYLGRYTDIDFDIDYKNWSVSFSKNDAQHIKISRGEENIFIWCLFMAICERVIAEHTSYAWVKYLYIDDPISSLDDNNAIAIATDLAQLMRNSKERLKVVFSSHHSLFFNVVCNEMKKMKHKKYFLHRPNYGTDYLLRATDDTPFFHHVAMLSELQKAADSGLLYTYHFNMLRSIMERTATFFGHDEFSACLSDVEDEGLYARALNLLSHGKYAIYEPQQMGEDNKDLFQRILNAFLAKFKFDLPKLDKELVPSSVSGDNPI